MRATCTYGRTTVHGARDAVAYRELGSASFAGFYRRAARTSSRCSSARSRSMASSSALCTRPSARRLRSAVPTSTLLVTGAALQVAPNILFIAHWDRLLGGALYAPLSRVDWATLLRRTFDVDVTRCTGWAGRMTVRAVVTAPGSIDRLLAALRRARDPPVAA